MERTIFVERSDFGKSLSLAEPYFTSNPASLTMKSISFFPEKKNTSSKYLFRCSPTTPSTRFGSRSAGISCVP
ncbi:MAG TPA: hypothetical protein VIO58_14235 [Candidatus Methanoperedens sp.]